MGIGAGEFETAGVALTVDGAGVVAEARAGGGIGW